MSATAMETPGPPYPGDGARTGGLPLDEDLDLDDLDERRAPPGGAATVSDAAERVVEAARGLVLDHIALVLLEARTLAQTVVRGAALSLVGALFLAATWGLAMATLYAGIGDAVPSWIRLGGITLGNGVVGAVLVVSGVRAFRRRSEAAS